jgi:hypothetical protein
MDSYVEQARIALATGDEAQARAILGEVLRKDPRHDRAWVLMSKIAEQPEYAVYCLNQALIANPGNEEAREALARLVPESVMYPLPPSPPTRHGIQPLPDDQPEPQAVKQAVAKARRRLVPWEWIGIVVGTLFLFICLLLATVWIFSPGFGLPQLFPAANAGQPVALGSGGVTPAAPANSDNSDSVVDLTPHPVGPVWIKAGGLTFGPDGYLYVVSTESHYVNGSTDYDHAVLRFDAATGDYLDVYLERGDGDLVFGPDGALYLFDKQAVLRYDGDELVTVVPAEALMVDSESGSEPLASLPNVLYLAFSPDNVLTITATERGEVLRADIETNEPVDKLGEGDLLLPVGAVFGPDGTFFTANSNSGEVLYSTGESFELLDTVLDRPSYLAFGPDGGLYATQWYQGSVVWLDPAVGGEPIEVVGELEEPQAIAFSPAGDLCVSIRFGGVLCFDPSSGDFLYDFPRGMQEASAE